jgi:hypothetical protein
MQVLREKLLQVISLNLMKEALVIRKIDVP